MTKKPNQFFERDGSHARRGSKTPLAIENLMKPENKQFIFILICTVIVFFGLDLVFKWGRNALLKKRIDQVQLGMSESEAVRVVGRSPVIITNGVKEITLLDHDSIFDVVFLQKMTSVGQSIVIESGKVVSVDWTLINR